MNESYVEVTIEGSVELVKGFFAGFLEGRDIAGNVFFGEEYHIETESPVGLLMRLTGIHGKTCTVIVGAGLSDLLSAALNKRRSIVPLRILKVRPVISAGFDVHFRTYSKEVGAELKNLLNQLPEGVISKSGFDLQEKFVPEGKGVEAYAPLHDYELHGKGRISGDVKGVFDLYHQLGRFEVDELGEMELIHGEAL
jgi:hypothetical protein